MAQHRTRRTTAKQATTIAPEELRAACAWLEQLLPTGPAEHLVPRLTAEGAPHSPATLVEALGQMATPEAAALLAQLAAKTEAKGLQKAIRRALYRLKTMGVATPGLAPQAPRRSVLEVPKLPVVAALASHIDGEGNRALYLARRRPFSGLVLVSLILNDQRGILDCRALPVTKKELSRLLEDLRADDRLTHIELPPSYAQQLVEESRQRNLATGTPLPREFQAVHDLIGTPDTRWERPPIYHLLNPEELRGQGALVSLSAQLLEAKELQGWGVPTDRVQKYREDVKRAAASPIIVSPALQQERREELQRRAIREVFDADTVARYRRRLEEMAYLFWQTKRPDDARRALAAALALQEGSDPAEHPLLRALFSRGVEMAAALERQEQGRVTVATPRLWTP
jgi:hypothetical protein